MRRPVGTGPGRDRRKGGAAARAALLGTRFVRLAKRGRPGAVPQAVRLPARSRRLH